MTTTRTLSRSFVGGVIAPEMYGRVDLRGYQTGLEQCDNAVVQPHGPVTKRPGFQFGFPIALGTITRARLVPFTTSGDAILLVFTETHVYFVRDNLPVCLPSGSFTASGSTVTKNTHGYSNGDIVFLGSFSGGYPDVGNYYAVSSVATNTFTATPVLSSLSTVPTSGDCAKVYRLTAATDTALLKTLRYSQSGSTLTVCSGSTAPVELARTSDASWAISVPDFETTQTAPTIAQVIPSTLSTSLADTKRYVATAVSESGEESLASLSGPSYPGYTTLASATNANPAVFTLTGASSHIVGDLVRLESLAGGTWSTLSGNEYEVLTVSGTDLTLKTQSTGVALSGVGLGTLTGGAVALVGTRCDLNVSGATVKVPVQNSSAYRYNVYKQDYATKLYGFVGTLDPETAERGNNYFMFTDDNIVPDITRTPPEDWNPFSGSGNYPLAVAHSEQRRIFGGTENDPQRIFLTPTGFEDSMQQHFPILDADAFDFTISSRVQHRIQHIVAVGDLLALSRSTEFQIKSGDGSALSPASVNARPQSYVGANDVTPAVAEGAVVFISASGERPHEVTYARDGSGGYVAVDIGIFAPHYFAGYTIVDLAYVRGDIPTLWAVRSDGALLSCTYMPGQEVRAWHKHTTDGTVQSVASVFEAYKDRLYIAVVRDVDGDDHLMIERLGEWQFANLEDARFLDSWVVYSGAATTSVTNLYHLEGETLTAFGDGKVFGNLTVSAGAVTLPEECETIVVGRPFTTRVKTLPVSFEIAGAGIGRPKNVSRAFLRVYKTSGVKAGPAFDDLVEYLEAPADYGDPNAVMSTVIEVPLNSRWQEDGAVCLESTDPRPLTIQAMSFEVTLGG